MRQILVNLLGNAIKFTEHGEVVLRVTREAATSQKEVVLHFSVKDSGVGIPRDRQKSIFEAFTQADGSTTRTYGGTGLGLTISSQLVELMGGRLWLESEVGKGSTFHFTVNFERANAATLEAPAADAVELQERHVLIAVANSTSRRVLEEMLLGWRMVPTLTASVRAALAALRSAQKSGRLFDLVLTDFLLPDADGLILVQAIKKDPVITGTSVVMLTSVGQAGDADRCRELGITAYLPKPIKRSDLRRAILLALGVKSVEGDRPSLVTQPSPRAAAPSGHFLVVEDNNINQLVTRRLLETHGHTVVVANNGRQALTRLDEAGSVEFSCVLMDIQMPEMDGFECTAIIRDKEKLTGSHLPIIGITAYAMKRDEARCLAAGMDAFLSKPIQPIEFFELVERYLTVASAPVASAAI